MQIGEIQRESISCKATEVKIIPYERTSERYWVSESCGWSSVDDEVKQKGYSNGQNNFCREVKCASKHKSTWQNMTKPKVTAWHDTTWHDKKVTPPQLFKIKHKNAKRLATFAPNTFSSQFLKRCSLCRSHVCIKTKQNINQRGKTWQSLRWQRDMTWHDKSDASAIIQDKAHQRSALATFVLKHFQRSVLEGRLGGVLLTAYWKVIPTACNQGNISTLTLS